MTSTCQGSTRTSQNDGPEGAAELQASRPPEAAAEHEARMPGGATAMLSLHGLAASRGYAIGRAVVLGAAALEVSHYRVADEDIEAECQRLTHAITVAREEFARLADNLPADAPREIQGLLHVHAMLLADPMLAQEPLGLIRE